MNLLSNKRGAELTMNTIIIAVLVLLVLVIILLIFNKTARNFFLGTSDCEGKEGRTCQYEKCNIGETNAFSGNPQCETKYGKGYVCCEQESTMLGVEQ
jgi:amino acid transporter